MYLLGIQLDLEDQAHPENHKNNTKCLIHSHTFRNSSPNK